MLLLFFLMLLVVYFYLFQPSIHHLQNVYDWYDLVAIFHLYIYFLN